MANLVSGHDRFHIHKILAPLVLGNFIYRFILTVCTGHAFGGTRPSFWDFASLLPHLLLQISAFMFELPKKRVRGLPLIWPEFRWHSLIFSARHIFFTWAWMARIGAPVPVPSETFINLVFVLATVVFAGTVSEYYHEKKPWLERDRTTNAMPYPSHFMALTISKIKSNYTKAQFLATTQCLIGNPTSAFWPLLAIQIAPFLMTLVHKGFLDAKQYHRYYAMSLMVPYYLVVPSILLGPITSWDLVWYGALASLARYARCEKRMRTGNVWLAVLLIDALGTGVCEQVRFRQFVPAKVELFLAWSVLTVYFVWTIPSVLCRYDALFC